MQRHVPTSVILCGVLAAACSSDQLTTQVAAIAITPLPAGTQVALEEPPGINFGQVPLDGFDTATFQLENVSTAVLEITGVTVASSSGGDYQAEVYFRNARAQLPLRLRAFGNEDSTARLVVTYRPRGDDGQVGEALVRLDTDNTAENSVAEVQVRGEAVFIGEKNLQVVYGSTVHNLPEDCTYDSAAPKVCVLPPLSFGKVTLGSSTTQVLTLRNVPAPGTCQLPNLSDGSPDCRPACVVTFDRDADHHNVGVGFLGDSAFGLSGNSNLSDVLPFYVAPTKSGCGSEGKMVRGDLDLKLKFDSADSPEDHSGMLVLESDDLGAPRILVPLEASSRVGPVAVAKVRACDANNLPPACTNPSDIEPLTRVYLDGRDSYDPNGLAITGYLWALESVPDGANPAFEAYDPQPPEATGSLFSLHVPLAGAYTLRLQVTNEEGVVSGITAESDVTFNVVPSSRLHIQLVWDDTENDQDLHLVKVDENGDALVYHGTHDCFWGNCRPEYLTDPNRDRTIFFAEDAPGEGGNPRLDIDATAGIGPENINIDDPRPGEYRLFVHYYGLENPNLNNPTEVTVRVYIDGALRREFRQVLTRDDLWAVAALTWTAAGDAVITDPQPGATTIVPLVTLPSRDEGFAFTPSPF